MLPFFLCIKYKNNYFLILSKLTQITEPNNLKNVGYMGYIFFNLGIYFDHIAPT